MDFNGVPNISANTIVSAIEDACVRLALPLDKCRGQSYDGASNMLGKGSGVAKQICDIQLRAYPTHCHAHSLNLSVKDMTTLSLWRMLLILPAKLSLLRLPVGYCGVLNSPRFCFFSLSKIGLPLMGYTAVQYTDCYLSPYQHDFFNSISGRIYRQNTQFNTYNTTSKQQEGCTFKDSHPKCFITTNFDKFHREAVAKGDESR